MESAIKEFYCSLVSFGFLIIRRVYHTDCTKRGIGDSCTIRIVDIVQSLPTFDTSLPNLCILWPPLVPQCRP